MVYTSKPKEQEGEQFEAWLLLEQTVLNARALALDAMSFANELRQEQALKATISPTYHKPPEKEEVFGDDLHETIKAENETNKLLNDAAWQRKKSQRQFNNGAKSGNNNLNFWKPSQTNSYRSNMNKGGYSGYSGNKKHLGNGFQSGQSNSTTTHHN